jgi:benzoate/toluate 1,2-dioxygenase alpha subunit
MFDTWRENSLNLDPSHVIDRRVYIDQQIYAAEQEKIFAKTWQWVAHATEIPEFGDYVTATVAGRAIVVARNEDGSIRAFFNTCTHRGAILAPHARGKTDGTFVCLYHGWCFDTAGKLTAVPLPDAYPEDLSKSRCYNIPNVRCELFGEHVFVCLDPAAPPLKDFLGAAGAEIEKGTGDGVALGRVRWVLEGNWKLWHENFRDNYHPMFAHQVLGFNYQGVKIEGSNHDLSGGHSLLTFPSQGNPKQIMWAISKITGRPAENTTALLERRGDQNVERPQHSILAIFPNLDFQYTTHPQASMVLQFVRPVAIDKAIVEIVVFGKKNDTPELRKLRLETALDGQTSAGKISGDDNEAVRRCSIGFSTAREVRWSNMDRGQKPGAVGAKNDEYSLRAFYKTYKEYLGDALTEAN